MQITPIYKNFTMKTRIALCVRKTRIQMNMPGIIKKNILTKKTGKIQKNSQTIRSFEDVTKVSLFFHT